MHNPTLARYLAAHARLERELSQVRRLRSSMRPTLPVAVAEMEMNDTPDLLDALEAKLIAALKIVAAECERIEQFETLENAA